MKNLFAKDTKKNQKTIAKNKTTVEIDNQENNLKEIYSLDEQIALLQAERKVLDAEVREASQDAMIKLYNDKKSFPGTMVVKSGSMELQFITMDKYKIIDEDRANELSEKYGEDLIDEETKFAFNTSILMKNMEAINKMILKSKEISDSDKEDLIEQSTSWKIAKGSIKNLKNEDFNQFDLEEIIDDIKPIFSIKTIKVSE
jgi:uncharacterized small protein (DUF1192 family)